MVNNPAANADDTGNSGSAPWWEGSPRRGNGSPLVAFLPGKLHGLRSLAG